MARRKLKVYPVHQCLSCPDMTTNKSYCDKCMRVFMSPAITTGRISNGIWADRDARVGRRNETIGRLI